MFSEKLPDRLKQYSGVIYFMLVLICAHFFWKFTVLGDDTDTLITFLGLDISAPFNAMAAHVARASQFILSLANYDLELLQHNVLKYENGVAVRIVWSCTGIKQAYIFFCLIAFYKGNLKHKFWYIPLGLVVVYITNIFRISAIIALIQNNPQWFDLIHEHLFKYFFYLVLFGIWVLWEEKIKSKN